MTALVVLFGMLALAGLGLFAIRLAGGNAPIGLCLLHAAGAATGLVLLGLFVAAGEARWGSVAALVLFGLAAALGGLAFRARLRGRLVRIELAAAHAVLALAGFGALLGGAIR